MSVETTLEDPTLPSLKGLVASGDVFSLPWRRERMSFMTGLKAREITDRDGPWTTTTPFVQHGSRLDVMLPDGLGGICSFKDSTSTDSRESVDHLSLHVGLTVGYPFLNVGAEVDYDKTVLENENGINASRNSSVRVGRIVLEDSPRFSQLAIDLLSEPDGPAKFSSAYGDYYVGGYELGAHAAACMSVATKTSSTDSKLSIAVKAKVLFFEAKATVATKEWHDETFEAHVTLVSYNTVDEGKSRKLSTDAKYMSDVTSMALAAQDILKSVDDLEGSVRRVMRGLGIADGVSISLSKCDAVCDSGMVMGLIMYPYTAMQEYQQVVLRSRKHGEKFA